jgi:hypothetical protein
MLGDEPLQPIDVRQGRQPVLDLEVAVGDASDATRLKAALDGIMTTSTRVAVIVGEDESYRGMLTADDLADGLG